MTKGTKVILGALTLVPWITLAVFFVFFFASFQSPGSAGHDGFMTMMIVHMAGVFINLGVTVFFVVHVLKWNPDIEEQNSKLLWALILFFGNMLANPIYFFMHVWPEKSEKNNPMESRFRDPRDGRLA